MNPTLLAYPAMASHNDAQCQTVSLSLHHRPNINYNQVFNERKLRKLSCWPHEYSHLIEEVKGLTGLVNYAADNDSDCTI